MKSALKIVLFLALATVLSGCTNALAVLELNNMAKEYIEIDDYKSAISRLESSVELDCNQFQTRYMLASAYLKEKRCKEALEHALWLTEARPEEPSSYSLKGDIYSCVSEEVLEEEIKIKNTNRINQENPQAIKKYIYDLTKANEAYSKYFDLIPTAEDSSFYLNKIEENKTKIAAIEPYLRKN